MDKGVTLTVKGEIKIKNKNKNDKSQVFKPHLLCYSFAKEIGNILAEAG